MADQKISQLTDGTSFQAGDEAVVNRSGTNYKVDPTQFGSLTVEGTNGNFEVATTGNSVNMTRAGNNFITASDAVGDLFLGAGGVSFLKIDNTGDISFYEDTGTTPKFFWDASAEALGIGTTSPSSLWSQANKLVIGDGGGNIGISIYGASAGNGRIAFVDTTTGNPGLDSGGMISYSHANNTMDFRINGAEAIRLDASGNLLVGTTTSPSDTGTVVADGIYLGGTGAANLLDDYEEGTFTPALKFGGGTTAITYDASGEVGTYTKIGNNVYIFIYIRLTNKGTDTGNATIGGLPFTVASNTANGRGSISAVDFSDMTSSLYNVLGLVLAADGSPANEILLRGLTAAAASTTALTDADLSNTSRLCLSFSYRTS